MTISTTQPHAAMDHFPHFLSTIRAEFPDDCEAIADDIIEAELGDSCWDSRIAERSFGIIEDWLMTEMRLAKKCESSDICAAITRLRTASWMPRARYIEALAEAVFLAPR